MNRADALAEVLRGITAEVGVDRSPLNGSNPDGDGLAMGAYAMLDAADVGRWSPEALAELAALVVRHAPVERMPGLAAVGADMARSADSIRILMQLDTEGVGVGVGVGVDVHAPDAWGDAARQTVLERSHAAERTASVRSRRRPNRGRKVIAAKTLRGRRRRGAS